MVKYYVKICGQSQYLISGDNELPFIIAEPPEPLHLGVAELLRRDAEKHLNINCVLERAINHGL